jgi:serine/threonine protein kinase
VKEETTLPRPFGDYLLVAQLGDDPLGSVYRALHSADEKRFVRLRILQSGELSPRLVAAVVEKLEARGAALAHDGIVRRPQFGVLSGVPYMAWYETAGWTLDRVLAMARAAKAPVTTEYALLLGDRMIEATEAATRFLERDLVPHGALWPGFVSISNDAEVRIAGFGLAPAVLPALRKPRVSREMAPYIAPEARDRKRPLANSDVYSLGIMLLELLTGRRPALGAPLPEIRSGDPFSREIGTFLKIALAPPDERYPTVGDMRRALQETMMAAPRLLYPAGLAFYLYRLLNPESTGVAPADADATNPVETEPRLANELSSDDSFEASARSFGPSPEPAVESAAPEPFDLDPTELSAALGDETGSAGLSLSDLPADLAAEGEADAPSEDEEEKSDVAVPDAALLEAARLRRPAPSGGTIALVVLAASVFGLALWIDTARARRLNAPLPPPDTVAAAEPSAAPLREPTTAPEPLPFQPEPHPATASALAVAPAAVPVALPAPRSLDANILRAQRLERERLRRSAEDLRLQAGLARVAAARLDGEQNAQEAFGEAADRERRGERLFRSGQFDDARDAFAEAARLYREAESVSHAERVKRVRLSPAP